MRTLDNVLCQQAALGDKPGWFAIDRMERNCGAHSLAVESAPKGERFPVVRIDGFAPPACLCQGRGRQGWQRAVAWRPTTQ